jgi:thiamine pyrophosphate-dependent acetolactate synthase large subunit-like protein
MMTEYESMRTADIVAEALLDWKVDVIFGLPGDGINGFIEALRLRQDKIKFVLVRHEESAARQVLCRWEQMGFLGNPEYGVGFSPIDYVKFPEACGGKGYAISEPSEVKSTMHQAMKERKPTIIEAYVDPFEPPMPPCKKMLYWSTK